MRFKGHRWFLAAVSMGFSVKLMGAGLKIEGFGAVGHLIFSMVCFISAVLLVAPETVFRFAEWCSRPFTNILFPSDEFSRPPLSYVLARRYRGSLRLRDAVEEYEKIIYFYPGEIDAYVELVDVAKRLGDKELTRRYAALFKKRFHREVPPFTERPDDAGSEVE